MFLPSDFDASGRDNLETKRAPDFVISDGDGFDDGWRQVLLSELGPRRHTKVSRVRQAAGHSTDTATTETGALDAVLV